MPPYGLLVTIGRLLRRDAVQVFPKSVLVAAKAHTAKWRFLGDVTPVWVEDREMKAETNGG